ncbi:MAG: glycosyltransferase [Planctomycetota bacterium]
MEKPLKILHVVPYFFPAWAYGGIPRIAYEICREQARRGHDVTVATTDVLNETQRVPFEKKGGAKFSDYIESIRQSIDGCTVYYFRNFSNALAYHMQAFLPLGLKSWAKKNVRRFDVVHMHGHRHMLNSAVARCARKAGVPYVMTANGTVLAIERRFLLKRIFDPLFGSHVLRGAAHFTAVSEAEIAQYEQAGIPRDRITVVYNGINLDDYENPPPPGTFKKERGLAGKKIILYLGKITPRKGIEFLVQAYAALLDEAGPVTRENSRLVIAGNDMGFRAKLESLADDLKLGGQVLFTGLLTGEEKLACYVDADVCAYPSTLEIFGLVPFESLMCGTPVIVTNDCGCGEVVARARAGRLVPYGDADALKDALAAALGADAEVLEEEVRRGKEFIRENLGYEKIAHEYVEVYRRLEAKQAGKGSR